MADASEDKQPLKPNEDKIYVSYVFLHSCNGSHNGLFSSIIFAKNCMKIKKNWTERGRACSCPRDPPLLFTDLELWVFYQLSRNTPTICDVIIRCYNFLEFFTVRVAKRAKVMFLQACVTYSVQRGGGGGGQHQWSTTSLPSSQDQVRTSTPPPPRTKSEHLPPTWDLVTLPRPPTWDLVTPPPLGTWSLHPPHLGLGHSTPPPPHYTQAGGTHPTGMHSCYHLFFWGCAHG